MDGGCNSQCDCSLALWQDVHHGWKQPLRNLGFLVFTKKGAASWKAWVCPLRKFFPTAFPYWNWVLVSTFIRAFPGCDRMPSAVTVNQHPPWRMNSKWSGNSFLLGSSSLVNHGSYLTCFFFSTYLLTTHKQVVSREVVKTALIYV
jgi:hypothetical protein